MHVTLLNMSQDRIKCEFDCLTVVTKELMRHHNLIFLLFLISMAIV